MVLELQKKIKELEEQLKEIKNIDNTDNHELVKNIEKQLAEYRESLCKKMTAWDKVQIARHQSRPTTIDYIKFIFDDFYEFHGDRRYADDKAIIGGIGVLNGHAYTIIGHQKGRNIEDNIYHNFGMPNPEGYRKAKRLMHQARKFKRPIITFIDTPGAYPGIGAEERGQAEAIAKNLYTMSELTVPIISFVIGEGGSGGAIAIGMGNKVYMLENAIYSILSPEGYASILWKDSSLAKEASEVMKLTADDLLEFKVIDGIITEPIGGAHLGIDDVAKQIKNKIIEDTIYFSNKSPNFIREQRYSKYRKMGVFNRYN